MVINPPSQYATADNLCARQRLWGLQDPPFDIVGWVLDLAVISAGCALRVVDVGCGNGVYLRELRHRGATAVGCDLSFGMLEAAAPHRPLVNTDVTKLPLSADSFDVVLAPHMLYHVGNRRTAVAEMRRVLKPDGVAVVVTNSGAHMRSLRVLVERAVRAATPDWEMRLPATQVFSLENGEEQLKPAFQSVTCVRPEGVAPVHVADPAVVADYVASVADLYQDQTTRPWRDVVADVRGDVQEQIDAHGAFVVESGAGAFVCR